MTRRAGLRDGGRAAHQEQEPAQHGRGQTSAKRRCDCGASQAGE